MTDNTHRDSGIITSSEVLAHYVEIALMYEELRAAIDDGHESMTHADALAEIAAIRAENVYLRAQLESIGAGGVSDPLMGCASIATNAGSEPVATVFTMEALAPGGGVKYHATVHEPLPAGTKLYTHPSPPRGMLGGWISVEERLPESDVPVLAHNGKWTGVAAWMSGDYLEPLERWQDEHREFIEMMGPAVTHWTPLPLPPTTSAGSGKGE